MAQASGEIGFDEDASYFDHVRASHVSRKLSHSLSLNTWGSVDPAEGSKLGGYGAGAHGG